MEHELSPTLAPPASAEFEGTPPEQPGVEHGSSIEEQLADAKARTQQWQVKRVVNEATKPFPIDVTDLTGATIKVEASLEVRSCVYIRLFVHCCTDAIKAQAAVTREAYRRSAVASLSISC
jgi:hypothetical protein